MGTHKSSDNCRTIPLACTVSQQSRRRGNEPPHHHDLVTQYLFLYPDTILLFSIQVQDGEVCAFEKNAHTQGQPFLKFHSLKRESLFCVLYVSGSWPTLNGSQVQLLINCASHRDRLCSEWGALWTRLLFRTKRWTAMKS